MTETAVPDPAGRLPQAPTLTPAPRMRAVSGEAAVQPGRGRRLWSGLWRLTLAAAVGVIAFGVVWPDTDTTGWSDAEFVAWTFGDLAAGVLALVLVGFRRRAPLAVAVVVVLLSTVSTFAVGAVLLALTSMAARRRMIEIVAAGVVFIGATVVSEMFAPAAAGSDVPPWQVVVVVVGVYALVVAVGMAIGARRALVASLQERAVLVERDQQRREVDVRDQERAHLAREMHDVLGHRLSLVALHAGALEYREQESAPGVAEAASVVRNEAHSALQDLRGILGVLRDTATPENDTTGTAPPQPSMRDLASLLEAARAAGADIQCVIDSDTHEKIVELRTDVGRHAYRIVQESLTNARRHAPGSPVTMTLEIIPGPVLHLVVRNPMPETTGPVGSTQGHGLVGLSERARLVGGSFHAGVTQVDGQRVYAVEAVLPWTN